MTWPSGRMNRTPSLSEMMVSRSMAFLIAAMTRSLPVSPRRRASSIISCVTRISFLSTASEPDEHVRDLEGGAGIGGRAHLRRVRQPLRLRLAKPFAHGLAQVVGPRDKAAHAAVPHLFHIALFLAG